jgi:UDP-glucose 4-epimerase
MRVLVTGSHGYIGSVLSKILKERGCELILGCDNDLTKDNAEWLFTRRLRSSFDDDFTVDQILQYKIDVIVHLAATSTVGPDAQDPWLYYLNNTARTIAFLYKLKQVGWKGHIIFASTAAVYGSYDRPVKEVDTRSPSSIYGHSKLLCERMLMHARRHDINTTTFRFFNVAGAYNGIGEEAEDTHLISKICNAALAGDPVSVYGNLYPTRDGTCIRDYVHVADICDAIIHSAENEVYGTYNLGTQRGISVTEMIEQFNMHTGQDVRYVISGPRQGDSPFLVADPGLFERQSGFMYKYTIRDIINSSWEHFKNGI